jgi:hypothetical protein
LVDLQGVKDNSSMNILWFLPFLIVFGSPFPLLVLFLYTSLRSEAPRLLNPIRMASLACLIAYLGFSYSRMRFTDGLVDFLSGLFAIGSYCFLASSAFEIPSKPLRVAVLFTLGAPVCIVTVFAAVGSLFSEHRNRTEQMRPDLVCRESSYGMVGAGGDKIELYKSWRGLPFIEKLVAGDQSDDSAPKANMSSCADLLRQYDDRK